MSTDAEQAKMQAAEQRQNQVEAELKKNLELIITRGSIKLENLQLKLLVKSY